MSWFRSYYYRMCYRGKRKILLIQLALAIGVVSFLLQIASLELVKLIQ